MSERLSVIKCPNCGADMAYDPALGALHCEYCDGTKAVEKRITVPRDFLNERNDGDVEEGAEDYECPNCGGHVTLENFAVTQECPFCGATNIVKKERMRGLKPDSILPFALSREQAFDFGRKWLKKRLYAPRKLKKNFKVDKFKGVYVPCFTFGSDTASSYSGRLGEYYYVTVGSGKNRRTVRRTRWFSVSGNFGKTYGNIVVESSSRLTQEQIEALLPYDLDTAEQYKKEYLAGFCAERYDSSLDDSFGVAKGIMDGDLRASILAQYRYDVVGDFDIATTYSNIRFNYILLPIWVCGYKYREKLYSFLVNGRTGKSTGKTPVSVAKVAATVAAGLAVIGALVYLIGFSGLI